jgi:glucose dehydrogenase
VISLRIQLLGCLACVLALCTTPLDAQRGAADGEWPTYGGDLGIYALTAGGTDDGPRLVSYDKTSGAELASIDLPGGAIGTPMTYMLDGKQYIALTVGGDRVPSLISLSLPD